MLLQIGSVTVEVMPFNAQEYTASSQTDFARKPLLGTPQKYEYVGEGERKLSVSGKLLPHHLGGLNHMAEIHAMRESGVPQFVLRGDLKVLGWHIIESVEEHSTGLDAQGIGRQVDFTINLCKAEAPAANNYTYSIYGLL